MQRKELPRTISRLRTPAYQADLVTIEAQFIADVEEVKKEIGFDFTVQQDLTKKAAERMFTELTKGLDMKKSNITPGQVTELTINSVAVWMGSAKKHWTSSVRR